MPSTESKKCRGPVVLREEEESVNIKKLRYLVVDDNRYLGSYSTIAILEIKFTDALETPGMFFNTVSTMFTQDAHVIPVIS